MSIESLKTCLEKDHTLDNLEEYDTVRFLLEFFENNTALISIEEKKRLYKIWKEKQKHCFFTEVSDEQA